MNSRFANYITQTLNQKVASCLLAKKAQMMTERFLDLPSNVGEKWQSICECYERKTNARIHNGGEVIDLSPQNVNDLVGMYAKLNESNRIRLRELVENNESITTLLGFIERNKDKSK